MASRLFSGPHIDVKKRRSKPRLSIITMTNLKGTIARRQFMRGTDPIKSTWEYPKSIR